MSSWSKRHCYPGSNFIVLDTISRYRTLNYNCNLRRGISQTRHGNIILWYCAGTAISGNVKIFLPGWGDHIGS